MFFRTAIGRSVSDEDLRVLERLDTHPTVVKKKGPGRTTKGRRTGGTPPSTPVRGAHQVVHQLHEIMMEKNLLIQDVTERAGACSDYWVKVKRGKINPTLAMMEAYANVLGHTIVIIPLED